MKKLLFFVVAFIAVFTVSTKLAMAEKPTTNTNGFDQYGYNDTARIFNGTGESWSLAKGLPEDYLGIYAPDKLVMKWNAEWDRGNTENWLNPPYAAWENNEWNGKTDGGSGEVWHYKIVWVGPQTWDVTGPYEMDVLFLGGNYGYDLTLNQSGNVVTGDLYDPYLPGNLTIFDGTINGNAIVFKVDYGSGSVQGIRTFTGTIDTFGLLSGSWSESGTENGSDTWSTTSGAALLTEGPYWVDGGTRIWEQFETIMDHGVDPNVGPGHIWLIHAIPNGYGSVK